LQNKFLIPVPILLITVIRPLGTTVREGLMFYCSFFFFHREISEVRGPISAKFCHTFGSVFNL